MGAVVNLPSYATREQVKEALDVAETARANRQVDRLLAAASRSIERLCHRHFYPAAGTRTFSWPNEQMGASWRLWLGRDEVISVDAITSGGAELTEFFLEPQASGPPYNRVELDLAAAGTFGGGASYQRAIAITGTFGYTADELLGGNLTAAVNGTEVELDVSDGAAVGVGDLLRLGGERMVVTGRSQLATGQLLGVDLVGQVNAQLVEVDDGTEFTIGEQLLIDAERMVVDDIAADRLIVRRAQDGSTLAAHNAGATIYAPRGLTVVRGACGTTAAAHADGAELAVHAPPGPVRTLAIAETLWALQQETSGYARVIGSGEAARQASATGIKGLRAEVYAGYGRKARKGVV
jgi:hypothetical protein